ncbi:hypothetical protein SEUCBS139899_003606 [Sporothrix eucalyptigena]|uniref:Zn(2)-C6 fungal-type domain-containing protein n=1 Tax=Sporothrix eucalyptigena TaxID=1812306 RepID=A0ABP0C9L6_9PEZI
MAPSFEDMTSTFVFSTPSHADEAVLAELPKGLLRDPSRERRSHRKSKTGCDNCKRRRVKCNEELPCAGCRRRGEVCGSGKTKTVQEHRVQQAVPKPMTTMAPSTSPSKSDGAVVNLLHLKLLHHFQVHTCQTLVFDAGAWAAALQLSFQFEFLSNAVLCVAARHLEFLHSDQKSGATGADPDASSYAASAATHLCRALAGFRQELMTKDFHTATHLDAFIATSILLQFELWSSTDFLPHSSQALDMERDRLFTFSASLKLVFLQSVPEALRRQPSSVFMPYIQHNPTIALAEHARIGSNTADAFRTFFARRPKIEDAVRHIGGSSMRQRLQEKLPSVRRIGEFSKESPWQPTPAYAITSAGIYTHVVDGLCLLSSFLPDAEPPHETFVAPEQLLTPLFADLNRSAFSFPILCRGSFVDMLHNNDLDAFFLLYHFYRAIRQLLPREACWWAHGRATVMEKSLHDWLQTT